MATDLLIVDGELSFDANGRALTVTGVDLVAQRVKRRLQTQSGEWCWNTTLGIDYRGAVMRKAPDLSFVRDLIVAALASVEGVSRIKSCTLVLRSRMLFVDFELATVDGGIIVAKGSGTEVLTAVNSLSIVGIADAFYNFGVGG